MFTGSHHSLSLVDDSAMLLIGAVARRLLLCVCVCGCHGDGRCWETLLWVLLLPVQER